MESGLPAGQTAALGNAGADDRAAVASIPESGAAPAPIRVDAERVCAAAEASGNKLRRSCRCWYTTVPLPGRRVRPQRDATRSSTRLSTWVACGPTRRSHLAALSSPRTAADRNRRTVIGDGTRLDADSADAGRADDLCLASEAATLICTGAKGARWRTSRRPRHLIAVPGGPDHQELQASPDRAACSAGAAHQRVPRYAGTAGPHREGVRSSR